eukprot:symbB.v1.2.006992.t1/scaffold426.1/size206518/7
MDCGADVEVCGVLTLETGEGKGNYQHPQPVVHGLWPQNGNYGTSDCDKPDNAADPRRIYPCFDTQGSESSASWFQKHEWEKHGVCAGVKNADDFFRQVCQLSSAPLQVMAGSRAAGQDLVDMADQLQRAGYCVYHIDTYNSQLQLSACQDETTGLWHLADVTSFSQVCGGGGGHSGGDTGKCITGQRGPRWSPGPNMSGCFAFLSLWTFAAAKPHIIMHVIDDFGWNDPGFRNENEISTPTLNLFHEKGITLDQYYVQPSCSPSRATFLSGRFPLHTGLNNYIPWYSAYGLPLDETTLPELPF